MSDVVLFTLVCLGGLAAGSAVLFSLVVLFAIEGVAQLARLIQSARRTRS